MKSLEEGGGGMSRIVDNRKWGGGDFVDPANRYLICKCQGKHTVAVKENTILACMVRHKGLHCRPGCK